MADKVWRLPELITTSPLTSEVDFAIIFLNQPIDTECYLFQKLFKAAKVRICADGGANQLYNSLTHSDSSKDFKEYLPDYICGDLDSLSSSVEAVYREQGVAIHHVPCQYSTDLDKCFKLVKIIEQALTGTASKKLGLFIYGGIGGRFDHNFACIHFLFKLEHNREAIIHTPGNTMLLLKTGYRHILPLDLKQLGPACGLIPIGGKLPPFHTEGLRWNLDGMSLEFGVLVSTSNLLDTSPLIVDLSLLSASDTSVLFTIEGKYP